VLGRGVTGYAWADAQYVKILGETGLAGLVAFIFLIFRLWRRARETFLVEQDPFCKGLAHGLLLGMVAMLAVWNLRSADNVREMGELLAELKDYSLVISGAASVQIEEINVRVFASEIKASFQSNSLAASLRLLPTHCIGT